MSPCIHLHPEAPGRKVPPAPSLNAWGLAFWYTREQRFEGETTYGVGEYAAAAFLERRMEVFPGGSTAPSEG